MDGSRSQAAPVRDPLLRSALGITAMIWPALLVIGVAATRFIQPNPSQLPFIEHTPFTWVDLWSRWDSAYFWDIAAHGYTNPQAIAFLPLFSILLAPFGHLGAVYWYVAPLITLVLGVAALWLTGLWTTEAFGPAAGPAVVACLAFFPWGFFLWVTYPTGLYIALTAGALLLVRRRSYPGAGALAALAAVTWHFGLMLALALVVGEVARNRRLQWRHAWLLLPALTTGAFALYCWAAKGDPLALLHATSLYWGRHLAWPWAPVLQTVHTLWNTQTFEIRERCATDLAVTVLFGSLLVGACRTRELTPTEKLYGGLCLALPLLSLNPPPSGLSGIPRFILAAVPLFAVLAMALRKWRADGVLLVSLVLQVLYFALFSARYWVA